MEPLSAVLKDNVDSWAIKINRTTGKKLGLKNKDIVEVFNRDRGDSKYYRVILDGRVKKDEAHINRMSAQLSGASNGDALDIMPAEEIPAEEVVLRVEMEGREREELLDIVKEINENGGEEIHNFFNEKNPVFNHGAKIYWEDKGISLTVAKISPFPYAVYTADTKVKVSVTSPFNGILMVYTSGSMYFNYIPNTPGLMKLSGDPIISKLMDDPKYEMLEQTVKSVETEKEILRIHAAITAVLLYFSEKAERELSERVGLISYSSQAKTAAYKYKGNIRYWLQIGAAGVETTEQYKEMLIKMLFAYIPKESNKPTNGVNAFEELDKLLTLMEKDSKKRMPTMIIILSDGEFNGWKGSFASTEDVLEVSEKIIEFVKERFPPSRGVIINAVYIGETPEQLEEIPEGEDADRLMKKKERAQIAIDTLKRITEITNGQLITPKEFKELAKFYESAAQSLIFDLGTTEKEDEEEGEDEEDVESEEEFDEEFEEDFEEDTEESEEEDFDDF
jgi:hypothetical protein